MQRDEAAGGAFPLKVLIHLSSRSATTPIDKQEDPRDHEDQVTAASPSTGQGAGHILGSLFPQGWALRTCE